MRERGPLSFCLMARDGPMSDTVMADVFTRMALSMRGGGTMESLLEQEHTTGPMVLHTWAPGARENLMDKVL